MGWQRVQAVILEPVRGPVYNRLGDTHYGSHVFRTEVCGSPQGVGEDGRDRTGQTRTRGNGLSLCILHRVRVIR